MTTGWVGQSTRIGVAVDKGDRKDSKSIGSSLFVVAEALKPLTHFGAAGVGG